MLLIAAGLSLFVQAAPCLHDANESVADDRLRLTATASSAHPAS